ncbi:MAG TPA: hypothetical protein VK691_09245 [Solirubrobacteraceae bacterium]|nr:hypothetical protein [Solirubrobacteraceae bacterium]
MYDENQGLSAMRKHGHHGWQWTPTYDARHGAARYAIPRRCGWDLRCEEAPCAEVGGRMTQRWKARRRRRRTGGRPR